MDYRENAGYIITDSCHVGDSEFVLGVHLTAPQQFVTWKCTGRTDYYWGHYFSDLFSAQKDFVARAQEEVQYLEEQRQNAIAPEARLIPHGGTYRSAKRSAPAFIPFPLRTWRHYGAPGTGGKGIPKRSTELRIYRRRVSLF